MRLLLDTHALLWGFMSPERLPRAVRTAIRSPDDQIFVSVASLWEIAVKMRNGKLNAPGDLPDLIQADPDYELLPILQPNTLGRSGGCHCCTAIRSTNCSSLRRSSKT